MDAKFQTSFIPKKSTPSFQSGSDYSVSVFLLVAVGVFVIALGFSAWAFFYQRSLVGNINELDQTLAKAKSSFELGFIDDVTKLNTQIDSAKDILGKHILLSPLFSLLEEKTLVNVRFSDFNFIADDLGNVNITMAGAAKSFNAIAEQSDIFAVESDFKNPSFSDFQLDKDGNVTFKFSAGVDSSLVMPKSVSVQNSQNATSSSGF